MKNRKFYRTLIGKKFNNIFKQFDFFVLNFKDPVKISIHASCFVRIIDKERLLMTASDEFFTHDGFEKTTDDYEKLEKEERIIDPNSLLAKNLQTVRNNLTNCVVKRIKTTASNDLIIYFDNGIIIQLIIDCLMRDFEYYRFIEFIPHFDDCFDNYKSVHYVAYNNDGRVFYKTEQE